MVEIMKSCKKHN